MHYLNECETQNWKEILIPAQFQITNVVFEHCDKIASQRAEERTSCCPFCAGGQLTRRFGEKEFRNNGERYHKKIYRNSEGCLPMHSYSSCLHCESFTARFSYECPNTLSYIVALKLSFVSFLHWCTVCDMVEAWASWFMANKKGNSAKRMMQKTEEREDNYQRWLATNLYFSACHIYAKRKKEQD